MTPESRLREWLRSGKLQGVKAGRLWRIRERDLEGFLEKRAVGQAQPLREYTRREIEEFLKADRIDPETARKVERLLNS
ncbi:MAG: helix-turn-helix domain-containing protein [Bacillota bacterium]